ncbi:hypothetical protein I3842_14G011700 [Carya illinoinensis]|uniref:Secreted protein n=1 Tax=Carya illinoinensis TaxID=32201 RepID=A0A922ADZ2_CARIL|nr:hypothetical protein I3842_14G011700 [Carya illinoinensis]
MVTWHILVAFFLYISILKVEAWISEAIATRNQILQLYTWWSATRSLTKDKQGNSELKFQTYSMHMINPTHAPIFRYSR